MQQTLNCQMLESGRRRTRCKAFPPSQSVSNDGNRILRGHLDVEMQWRGWASPHGRLISA